MTLRHLARADQSNQITFPAACMAGVSIRVRSYGPGADVAVSRRVFTVPKWPREVNAPHAKGWVPQRQQIREGGERWLTLEIQR